MSMFFPDVLSIFVEPNRVRAVRTSRFRRRVLEAHQREVSVCEANGLQALTQACDELLQLTQTRYLKVILSDQLVRYGCFDWDENLPEPERNSTSDTSGVHHVAAGLHFAMAKVLPGQPRLQVVTPKSLYDHLQHNLGLKHAKVISARTSLGLTLSTFRGELGKQGWLANLEEGHVTVCNWSKSGWGRIYSAAIGPSTPEALITSLYRQIKQTHSAFNQPISVDAYVHAPTLEQQAFSTMEGLNLVRLRSPISITNSDYAFALMGATH